MKIRNVVAIVSAMVLVTTQSAFATSYLYMVIDLSGGAGATNYPVTYLEAVPLGGWTDEYKTDKLVMRRIPATTPFFTMGGRATDYPDALDFGLHQVTLTTDFYIGVFEVTQRQWERVMGNKPSYFNNTACYATRPVEQVSYYDIRENPGNGDDPAVDWPANSAVNATSFMGKLRAKTGLSTFDLPTESQREYACRAWTETALNSGYNLTNTTSDARMSSVGRYWYNGPDTYGYDRSVSTNGGTAAAGSYLPNAWGLYDMHGNVLEWCLDWYGTYPGSVQDPLGAASGYGRVSRGGSWGYGANYCRSANRFSDFPDYRGGSVGFRAARTLPKYNLTVVGGTGSGGYDPATAVAVAADTPPPGKDFACWAISPTDAVLGAGFSATQSVVTVTMPEYNVTLTAVFVGIGGPLYLIIDLSGGAGATNYPVTYLEAVPPGGWTDEYKTDKLVMRLIPATTPHFTMGGRATDYPGAFDEGLHQVTLTKDFYIGVFEVTQRQWERVMGNKPSYFNNAACYATRPVEQVSYYDIRENPANSDDLTVDWPSNSVVNATSFMGKLREKTGLSTFDLPTESQWEYACRAGTTTALNSGYNLTGTDSDSRMADVGRYWYNGGSDYTQNGSMNVGTAAVGSYLPNARGLYDMHGNVLEWCLDWYGTYPGSVQDPLGAASGSSRVGRGGSWYGYAGNCRSAVRSGGHPTGRYDIIGFRAAKPASTYSLKVVGGTGSSGYDPAMAVVVAADTPPPGQAFARWTVSPTNAVLGAGFSATQSVVTVTMPEYGVTLTAVFEGIGGPLYLIIDLSGGAGATNYPVTYLEAVPQGGWTDAYKTDKLVMRRIPATTPHFTMGGRATDYPGAFDEGLHQVTLTKDFYIGVFEVTQRQWERVMGNKPSYFNNAACYATRPVEQVSYYDIRENPAISDDPAVDWPSNSAVNATSFMGKLRVKTGLSTFDLPTESQWEYACRAGTTTALNSGYNLTGTDSDSRIDVVGRYLHNGGTGYTQNGSTNVGSAAAGSYLPNAWGLYDMHGNVFEWCLDWFGTYPGSVQDPLGAASGSWRVGRGGSWYYGAYFCRSAYRNGGNPNDRYSDFGFRAARTLPARTYSLTIVGGMGSGSYPEGATAEVSANPDPLWKEFDVWTGDAAGLVADPVSRITSLTMPARPASLTATYRDSIPRVAGCFGRTFTPSGASGGVSADPASSSPSGTPAVKLGGTGVVPDSGFAAFETTVTGGGTVTFWWRVSSESNADYLKFKVDGVQVAAISGTEGAWAQVTQRVNGAGVSHTLRWEYVKNGSLASSTDAGWVDDIVWTGDVSAPAIAPDILGVVQTNSMLSLTFQGERGVPYTVYSNATLRTVGWGPMIILPQQKGETNGIFLYEAVVLPPVGQHSGFYKIMGGDTP